MNLILYRKSFSPQAISGKLYIEGVAICDTAENPTTALPPGVYPIAILHCHQYARRMPVIVPQNKSPYTSGISPYSYDACITCKKLPCVNHNTKLPQVCHMLKPGNGVCTREDGSIILGTYICHGSLKHSKDAFNGIFERIRKAAQRGQQITLTIEDYVTPIPSLLSNYK